MMTSVTLASNSGTIHGGYSTAAAAAEETPVFETPRPVKRYLTPTSVGIASALSESCKKRRKQSTPVRISASDLLNEGKVPSAFPDYAIEEGAADNHAADQEFECKKEPADSPPTMDSPDAAAALEPAPVKSDLPWMPDLSNKDWVNPNLLPFPPANHLFMGLPAFAQADSMPPRQPIRIFNPDAYCELCNKEFCNKYFLKTHKANKHGIYSDPQTSSDVNAMSSVNIPSYVKVLTAVPSETNIKVESKHHSNILSPYPELYPNPYANKLYHKQPSKPIYDIENADHSNMLNDTNPHDNSDQQELSDTSKSPKNQVEIKQEEDLTIDKLSPLQSSVSEAGSSRYRRVGVMNPKAFCEICCKEYCNKYFLRTHKMKRHGIYIPDDREKDIKIEQPSGMPYIQTSPLNLIMAEQSNNSDRKTYSPPDISCELCGIKFQNASLFQLHNVSMHAKMNNQEGDKNEQIGGSTEKSTDSISEDLQKLQTMILQLNDLDVNKAGTCCSVCNKELENRYALHAHMMTEHGLLLDDNAESEKNVDGDANANNNTMCDLCGKDFAHFDDLKKHTAEAHGNSQTTTEEVFTPPDTKGQLKTPAINALGNERRSSMNMTPTSSYCEICNKELCNKYFMKTHMQRMHGIEIENGAQIGGVICDICNKELCSKYFLRVHKHNTHGIVEYGSSLLQPRKTEEVITPTTNESDQALKPADLAELSHRYFTHFTEVCSICSRRFRSTKWLKAHLLSDHGQAGAQKWAELEQELQHTMGQTPNSKQVLKTERISPSLKIPASENAAPPNRIPFPNVLSSIFGTDDTTAAKTYHCSYCPFSTPILPFLFVHERSHSMQGAEGESVPLKCPMCPQAFTQPEMLQHHMFSQHPFLPIPPFFNGNSEMIEAKESDGQDEHEDPVKYKKASLPATKRKQVRLELPPEMDQTLKDIVKKTQLPATYTYALPQNTANGAEDSNYVMQAFIMEEQSPAAASATEPQGKFMPSVVFLPVLQKLSAPITATFTFTPA